MAHEIRGGMEMHVYLLAEELAARGHQVSILTTSLRDGRESEERKGIHSYFIKGSVPVKYRRSWWKKSLAFFQDLHSRKPVDLVISESAAGESFAASHSHVTASIPLITVLHGTFYREIQADWHSFLKGYGGIHSVLRIPIAFYRHLTLRRHITCADHIIAVTQELAETVINRYQVSPLKVEVIPNAVNVDMFQPLAGNKNQLISEFGGSIDTRFLLLVGRLEREKGGLFALQALREISHVLSQNVKLIVIGHGKFRTEMASLAHQLELRDQVFFIGHVPHEELPRYYAAADVLLIPSICNEGLPFVVLEAMACGLPIVASRIGGIPSAITDGRDGILIPPGDAKALAFQTLRILTDKKLSYDMRHRTREKAVREFSKERMMENTIQVIKRCLASKTEN